jgi:gluconate 2-dehydrogenase gamma chain
LGGQLTGVLRRDVLKSLGMSLVAGSLTRAIPLQAAQYAHKVIRTEKSPKDGYKPKYFSPHQYKTLLALCAAIIPSEDGAGGAIEAGAPEFIDLLTSENHEFQLKLGGGMMWLDSACMDRFDKAYISCSPDQHTQILDLIAYRKNATSAPALSPGIEFFSFLRKFVADGYFTSEIGIKYLEYIGNTSLREFPGCPEVAEA